MFNLLPRCELWFLGNVSLTKDRFMRVVAALQICCRSALLWPPCLMANYARSRFW